MKPPDYEFGIRSLRENLTALSDGDGHVAPENRALWNLSQALLEAIASLHAIEERVQIIERMLTQ